MSNLYTLPVLSECVDAGCIYIDTYICVVESAVGGALFEASILVGCSQGWLPYVSASLGNFERFCFSDKHRLPWIVCC